MADKKYYDANGKMMRRVKSKNSEDQKTTGSKNDSRRAGGPSACKPDKSPGREWSRSKNDNREETADLDNENSNILIGRNPVMEALKSGRTIEKILVLRDGEGSIRKIAAMAREAQVQVQFVDKQVLERIAGGGSHQGIIAYVSAYAYCELEDLLQIAKDKNEDPFVILLDGLEDPHNLGAIMRTANAAGAHGIIIPNRRSASLNETVAKASAGAIEYVPVAKVSNLVQTMEWLKERGVWLAACDMDGETYHQAKLTGSLGLVIGGEGNGVGRLVKEHCDFIVSIPMKGQISSLNASNAAAVLMYEILRQREGAMAR